MQTHPETSTLSPITIDVISDVVCPWCYIGKRHLEQALAQLAVREGGSPAVVVRWHPFQLNPDMPREGMARGEYLKAKFGESSGGESYRHVATAASAAGLNLNLDAIQRQPNTIAAHAMLAMAGDAIQDRLVENLFAAYFVHGKDLSAEADLIEIGRDSALPEPSIEAALSDDSVHQAIDAADRQARDLGVTGVPFYIINQRLAVNGAVGADTLLAAVDKAIVDAVAPDGADDADAPGEDDGDPADVKRT